MRVLLVSANTERLNMVTIPLGLGLVTAAARQAGHEVTFLDLLTEPDPQAALRSALERSQPDVIGISVRNIDDQNRDSPRFLLEQVKPLVEQCRAGSSAPVVLGGAGYSIFPQEALSYLGADYGVCGDGEVVFPALLEKLHRGEDPGELPGVYVAGRHADGGHSRSERIAGGDASGANHDGERPGGGHLRDGRASAGDLDPLPIWEECLTATFDPRREEFKNDLWIPVQSRRGCPNDCSYCSTASIQGRVIRSRSPALVVDGIARLARAGYRRFYFVDNSFNIPEAHALELCRLLAALQPPVVWRCILYPQDVREELVRAMADSGCVEVSLGCESGSPAVLREMNKRFTPEEVRGIVDLLTAHGIRRRGFLLLGGPGETRATVEESLAFISSLPLDEVKITVGIRIYPGTPLARRAVAERVIASEDELLHPRFYLAAGLEPWIHDRVAAFTAGR